MEELEKNSGRRIEWNIELRSRLCQVMDQYKLFDFPDMRDWTYEERLEARARLQEYIPVPVSDKAFGMAAYKMWVLHWNKDFSVPGKGMTISLNEREGYLLWVKFKIEKLRKLADIYYN